MQGEIWRRSRFLIAFLLEEIQGSENQESRLPDLIAHGASIPNQKRPGETLWSAKTVENTIRELVAFGALRLAQRGRDRFAIVTVLGLAWVHGQALPKIDQLDQLEEAVERMYAGEDAAHGYAYSIDP
jgi:hypothetical protein